MKTPEYLYHYTSLETLALILENRTLCFNNLLNVDDIEEAETSDLKNFGKYVCVSCWTDEEQEMIPMWNLYTPNMHGVRIRLPASPFVKYHYHAGEFYCTEDIDTCINMESLFIENKSMIPLVLPLLVPVTYTDDKEKLCPKVRTKGNAEEIAQYISGVRKTNEVTYHLGNLGRYKSTAWSFQKEWRYILQFVPWGWQEAEKADFEKNREFIRRLEDTEREPPYQRYFLEISPEAVEQMEIVFGPRMSESEKILAKSLLHAHNLDGHWRDSTLKIR